MTFGKWLESATKKLKTSGVDSARLDALILLEDAVGFDRSYLLAHLELILKTAALLNLNKLLRRRINHEPLAYIRGHIEFYGHNFLVTPDVLIPRPGSEAFLELLLKLKPADNQKLIDVGTGCGALAISAKLLLPNLQVAASDTSLKALRVAQLNAKKLGAKINFFTDDLLTKPSTYNFILANLPYVPKNYSVSPEVLAEPKTAVFADDNGLALINKLALQAITSLNPGGFILLESLLQQQTDLNKYYQAAGFKLINKLGLVQVFQKPFSSE